MRTGTMEIQTENADIVVTGGAESMSRAEFYIPGEFMKWGVGGMTDPSGVLPGITEA